MSDGLMRGDQSAFLRALGHISLGSVEDSLDLGPDERDAGRGYYVETGDHDEVALECPQCHAEPCECEPDESREAWRWPQDT